MAFQKRRTRRGDRPAFVRARWTSGKQGKALAAFNPVTANTQGWVFQAKLSGIAVFKEAYLLRLARPLTAEVSALYFICTDRETFPVDGDNNSYLPHERTRTWGR
jgi:hypothetical protein